MCRHLEPCRYLLPVEAGMYMFPRCVRMANCCRSNDNDDSMLALACGPLNCHSVTDGRATSEAVADTSTGSSRHSVSTI